MRKVSALIALGLAFFGAPAYVHAISEYEYRESFDQQVLPFIDSHAVHGEFTGQGGVPIRYRKVEVPNEHGAIVFSQGFTGSYLLNAELQYDLVQRGYSVYELDHRGQGLSGRLHADLMPGYVDRFDYFAADLKTFVDTVVNTVPHEHRYLLAYSMGGPIAALYLAANPGQFKAAALAVPMMEVDVGDRTEEQALHEIAQLIAQGKGVEYSWGEGPYNPHSHHDPNSTDGRDQRLCAIEDLLLAHPQAALGGASWQWMYESVIGSRKARTEAAQAIDIPVLMLVAGKDYVVRRGGQDEFCQNAQSCFTFEMVDSSHGMLVEKDILRDYALRAIFDFFERHR
jgi:lysophospholipase